MAKKKAAPNEDTKVKRKKSSEKKKYRGYQDHPAQEDIIKDTNKKT